MTRDPPQKIKLYSLKLLTKYPVTLELKKRLIGSFNGVKKETDDEEVKQGIKSVYKAMNYSPIKQALIDYRWRFVEAISFFILGLIIERIF